MALRAQLLFGTRLGAAGVMVSAPPGMRMCSLSLFAHTSSPTAAAARPSNGSNHRDDIIITGSDGNAFPEGLPEDAIEVTAAAAVAMTTGSSNSNVIITGSDGDVFAESLEDAAAKRAEAAERIGRAAAALDGRAVRGGFVPSADAHLETAAQFGGPGASAMGDMVQAVYSACTGDGRTVERSVEHLTQGTAGIPRKPLSTRWARSSASSTHHDDEAEAAAIRETLTAYRFAGVAPAREFAPEPEAPAHDQPSISSQETAEAGAGRTTT